MEKNPSILRFGSLSVKVILKFIQSAQNAGQSICSIALHSFKVKKTTEAFNNYFGSGNGSETKLKWENNNGDKEKMPPPRFAPVSCLWPSC